jgi:hypothetical protein
MMMMQETQALLQQLFATVSTLARPHTLLPPTQPAGAAQSPPSAQQPDDSASKFIPSYSLLTALEGAQGQAGAADSSDGFQRTASSSSASSLRSARVAQTKGGKKGGEGSPPSTDSQ